MRHYAHVPGTNVYHFKSSTANCQGSSLWCMFFLKDHYSSFVTAFICIEMMATKQVTYYVWMSSVLSENVDLLGTFSTRICLLNLFQNTGSPHEVHARFDPQLSFVLADGTKKHSSHIYQVKHSILRRYGVAGTCIGRGGGCTGGFEAKVCSPPGSSCCLLESWSC